MKYRVWLIAVVVLVLALSAAMLVGCSSDDADEAVDTTTSEETTNERPSWVDDLVKGDGKTVLIGSDTGYPPFEFQSDDGTDFQGFDVDLMNAIGEKLNVEFQFKTYDFDGIIAGLAAGTEFDMVVSALTIKPSRYEEVDFGLPYYMDKLGLAASNDSTISSLDDVGEGTRVAVQTGSSAQIWAENNLDDGVKFVTNADTATLFQALQAGDADVLIQDLSSIEEFVADPVRDAKLIAEINAGQFFGMAFQRNDKGAAMKADIDNALLQVVANGTYAQIFKKWFGVEPTFLPGDATLEEALAVTAGM
jgi:ABC-type amino acid transport substrate-binding protein